MSISNINGAGVAAHAIGKAGSARDASAQGASAAPVFSRGADARSMPSLMRACQMNGHIDNEAFVREAATGDLMRVVRDVKNGKVAEVQRHLQEMSTIKLGEFFRNERIDPSLLDQLKAAVSSRTEPKAMLAAVYEVLDRTGASRMHAQLRPASST